METPSGIIIGATVVIVPAAVPDALDSTTQIIKVIKGINEGDT
jgi:hypothetical protein